MRTHRLIPLAIAATAAIAPAAAQAAETTLAVEQRPFSISEHAGTIAWSSYDAGTDRFHLMARRDGQAARLPVAPSSEPFDVDLGAGRDGATVAVYSRPDGDLYRYDFAGGREVRLAWASSPVFAEREPSISGDVLVFIRNERARGGGRQDVLRRVASKPGRSPSRAVFKAGSRLDARVLDAQVQRGRIAFVASRSGDDGFGAVQKLFLGGRGSAPRDVYRAASGGANFAQIITPTFDAGARSLFWARTNTGSGTGNRYVRRALSTGRTVYAQGSDETVSTSWAGGTVGFVTATAFAGSACLNNELTDPPEASRCRLITTGPPAFDARP